jgi:hypothetical protein
MSGWRRRVPPFLRTSASEYSAEIVYMGVAGLSLPTPTMSQYGWASAQHVYGVCTEYMLQTGQETRRGAKRRMPTMQGPPR